MKKVTDELWIAPQPQEAGIVAAAGRGFSTIVNNRPDGEEPGQPTAAQNRKAAEAHGLKYFHVPVVSGQISEGQVRDFQKALAASGGPVLAHCKTGTRSLTLWAIGEVLDGRMTKGEIPPLGQRLGIDLAGASKWLDANS
jgi:uncharacterized protein (TIGR01244 family)